MNYSLQKGDCQLWLTVALENQGVKKLEVNEKEVRRMLDPHHSTRLPSLDKAIRALGKKLTVSLEEAA